MIYWGKNTIRLSLTAEEASNCGFDHSIPFLLRRKLFADGSLRLELSCDSLQEGLANGEAVVWIPPARTSQGLQGSPDPRTRSQDGRSRSWSPESVAEVSAIDLGGLNAGLKP